MCFVSISSIVGLMIHEISTMSVSDADAPHSQFVSFGCILVYCFPSFIGVPPHRHPRFSRFGGNLRNPAINGADSSLQGRGRGGYDIRRILDCSTFCSGLVRQMPTVGIFDGPGCRVVSSLEYVHCVWICMCSFVFGHTHDGSKRS